MLTKFIKRFIHDDAGQGTIEYAAMLALAAIIAFAVAREWGIKLTPALVNAFISVQVYLAKFI